MLSEGGDVSGTIQGDPGPENLNSRRNPNRDLPGPMHLPFRGSLKGQAHQAVSVHEASQVHEPSPEGKACGGSQLDSITIEGTCKHALAVH